jgi:uncharacterized protein
MQITLFTAILFLGSLLAGFLGALTGLGGGVVIVPLLTLVFGIDIRYAVGASLVSVIATSSGAAAAYVREGFSNIRIGMFLEIATTFGALAGAYLATRLPTKIIGIIFGLMLLFSAYFSSREPQDTSDQEKPNRLAHFLKLEGTYPVAHGQKFYRATRVPLGFGMMYIAGILSGLLGIGSGAMKVLAMDQAMRLPFKVSTTTSNFMIGVTAAASAGIYLSRGFLDPGLAMPVMLGVLAGSMAGATILVKAKSRSLRIIFAFVIVALGIEMIFNAIKGRL